MHVRVRDCGRAGGQSGGPRDGMCACACVRACAYARACVLATFRSRRRRPPRAAPPRAPTRTAARAQARKINCTYLISFVQRAMPQWTQSPHIPRAALRVLARPSPDRPGPPWATARSPPSRSVSACVRASACSVPCLRHASRHHDALGGRLLQVHRLQHRLPSEATIMHSHIVKRPPAPPRFPPSEGIMMDSHIVGRRGLHGLSHGICDAGCADGPRDDLD